MEHLFNVLIGCLKFGGLNQVHGLINHLHSLWVSYLWHDIFTTCTIILENTCISYTPVGNIQKRQMDIQR